MEKIIYDLVLFQPWVIYLALFASAFLENLFPPLPCDMVIIYAGYLAGIGHADFKLVLFFTCLGSTSGFMLMYFFGKIFGQKVIERGRFGFITREAVQKMHAWFERYGLWLIVVKRFLAGTRAVVSFMAGMMKINFPLATLLCAVSALTWNAILVAAGYHLGKNWEKIRLSLSIYSQVIMGVIAVILFVWLIRRIRARRSRQDIEP